MEAGGLISADMPGTITVAALTGLSGIFTSLIFAREIGMSPVFIPPVLASRSVMAAGGGAGEALWGRGAMLLGQRLRSRRLVRAKCGRACGDCKGSGRERRKMGLFIGRGSVLEGEDSVRWPRLRGCRASLAGTAGAAVPTWASWSQADAWGSVLYNRRFGFGW